MSSNPKHCWLLAALICCAASSVAAQVSVHSVTSQVQNSRLVVVVTLSRWQGNFSYQLTVPAGEVSALCTTAHSSHRAETVPCCLLQSMSITVSRRCTGYPIAAASSNVSWVPQQDIVLTLCPSTSSTVDRRGALCLLCSG